MKSHSALPTCFLLLWTFAVFVSCQGKESEMQVNELADGIKLVCPTGYHIEGEGEGTKEKELAYKDENTGEYKCLITDTTDENKKPLGIFVKFRSCDNCIELDTASISGIIIGDVVATIVVGVGVYLIASQARPGPGPVTSNRKSKSSDRQHLVSESRGGNDHYQPLRGGHKDTYEELTHRR